MAPIALTLGDSAGIGPEIALKLLLDPTLAANTRVYGSKHVLRLTADHLGLPYPKADILDVTDRLPPDARRAIEALDAIPYGQSFAPFGHLQGEALNAAIKDALSGAVSGICTAPLNKALFADAGLPPTGHTEILVEKTDAEKWVMMLAGDRLRVSLVTTHVPLGAVPSKLTQQRILDVIATTDADLKRLWGISKPRIAVAALNPHAGERGTMGRDEITTIAPAIAKAQAQGFDATGPWPADTLLAGARDESWAYDAVVCMYHDQALIPLKLLHFGRSANITLGLPIVRTSVDHGTAYDIAGQGIADEGSLRYALELAQDFVARRRQG